MADDDTRELRREDTQQLPMTRAVRQTRRVVVGILGGLVTGAGIALSLPGIPGPGLLIVLGGLTILSWEFPWAKRLLLKVRNKIRQIRERRRDRRRG